MNGLVLRITTGARKPKNTMALPPVVITNLPDNNAGGENEFIGIFMQAGTADEQLAILKKVLDKEKDRINLHIVKLLVVAFFYAEAKHPIKGFLTRHINKSQHLQEPFIELLTSEIAKHLQTHIPQDDACKTYKHVVSKIGMCIENFPAGTLAVQKIEDKISLYLTKCLDCCVYTLNCYVCRQPSPTEKSMVYNLAHLTLRIMLHTITKSQSEPGGLRSHLELVKILQWNSSKTIIKLLEDRDVPMDTKSVCGIVLLSLDAYTFSPPNTEIWKTYLYPPKSDAMTDEHVKLAMFSAIITTVRMEKLQEILEKDGNPAAIAFIVQEFMDIVERSSSDGVLILGVTRALHQLSKGLFQLEVPLGLLMTDRLLAFVWAHLEHYMDSVRHLTAQMLACIVQYCAHLETTGLDRRALSAALASLGALGAARRGFHAGCGGAARALGAARVLRDVAPLPRLLPALRIEQVAATARVTLEALLQSHSQETEASVIHEQWVLPILHFVQGNELESEVLTILENLLAKAIKLDQKLLTYILPHIKLCSECPEPELKTLLLLLSAARAHLADDAGANTHMWRGIISYDILNEAIVDANDEIRLQCLALVSAGAGARAGGVARGELTLLLRCLAYSMEAQAPHARTRALAMLSKFLKRVFDGYRAAKRRGDNERARMYADFLEELRQLCYAGLQCGANYSRRYTALKLLQCCEPAALPDYQRTWQLDYVEKLLQRLDDSYEANKVLALDILQHVPLELIKDVKHSVSLKLEDIIRQANALKPTECVSAAYKLELLWRRLPDNILQGKPCEAAEPALLTLLTELRGAACVFRPTWHSLSYDAVRAPRDCPTYGLLYCIAHLLDRMDPHVISEDRKWTQLFSDIIRTCENKIEDASGVVYHAAPEGIMPADCQYSDYGNNAGVMLDDGRQITAQMVLLCAWRTVKEATAVLGAVGARAQVPGSLSAFALQELAEALAHVLASARHRGAIEQAYVAYERVLHRMWREPHECVRRMVAIRLEETLAWLRGGSAWTHGADRRSAGFPFLIQALVSTEVGAGGPGTGLHDVMTELLRRAETGAEAEERAHACNVLRALYRDSTLDTAVQGYVGEGLRVALKGFEGASWAERNSSTLLLSALMTRVFGVSRARAALSARNRMTGRVFYLRYPSLYDIMLNKLKEVSESESKMLLCPSLYPVLLILARLYPSSLEGTESNLKLVSFVPYVVSCARARALHTRRLAAAAAVSLIAPARYVAHVEYLLGLVSDARVERNYCHGILLQLCALLENKPQGLDCDGWSEGVVGTLWIVARAPCYPVLHQYLRLLSLLIQRFPETMQKDSLDTIESKLKEIVMKSRASAAACGRELCLGDCLRLLLLLMERRCATDDIADWVVSALVHEVHEVCGASLDYLLALHGRGEAVAEEEVVTQARAVADEEVAIQAGTAAYEEVATQAGADEEMAIQAGAAAEEEAAAQARGTARADEILSALCGRPEYMEHLVQPLRDEALWRCDPQRAVKHLEVLVAEGGTQELILGAPPPGVRVHPGDIADSLATLVNEGPDCTTHLYLESLTDYLSRGLVARGCGAGLRCVARQPAGAARRACRVLAARFLRLHARALLATASTLPEPQAWETEREVVLGAAWLLQDAAAGIRASAAATVQAIIGRVSRAVVPTLAGELLLQYCAGRRGAAALLTVLALSTAPALPPASVPRITDECRVFEPSEKFNVHGEEALWAAACADKVVELCTREGVDPLTHVASFIRKCHFPRDTLEAFDKIARGDAVTADHSCVEVFVRKLKAAA